MTPALMEPMVALLGISGRMGWMELPGDLNALTNPLIIGLAILLFVVEFVADKVPYVDSAWDSVHTFIRPLGAASLFHQTPKPAVGP